MERENTCETCKYFIRHYRKEKESFLPVADGHCMHPRIKLRKYFTKACEQYKPQ